MADDNTVNMPQNIAVVAATLPIKRNYGFQPGHKSYKPKGITELRNMARECTMRMLQVIIEIAEDPDEKGSVRIAAADLVLCRAWGKAEAYHDKDDKALTASPTELTSAQIMQMLDSVQGADPKELEPPANDTVSLEHSEQLAISQSD